MVRCIFNSTHDMVRFDQTLSEGNVNSYKPQIIVIFYVKMIFVTEKIARIKNNSFV